MPSPMKLSVPEREAKGLNMRTSIFGCAASAANPSVLCTRVHVIDEDPDLDAAIRGFEQLPRDENPREVGMPDVGLYIEGAPCKTRALYLCGEGLRTLLDQAKRGLTGMLRLGRRDDLVQLTLLAGWDGALDRQLWPGL